MFLYKLLVEVLLMIAEYDRRSRWTAGRHVFDRCMIGATIDLMLTVLMFVSWMKMKCCDVTLS